jgi:hypothetical protein
MPFKKRGRRKPVNLNPAARVIENGTNGDFWDTVRRKAHGFPEQELLLAVLKDALLIYRKSMRRPNKTFEAERAWFFANDTDRLFSFECVCAVLGLSAGRIRQHLRAWERESMYAGKKHWFTKTGEQLKVLDRFNG